MSKTIGSFEALNDGYVGVISTLQLKLGDVRLVAASSRRSADSPDFIIQSGGIEIGAGWKATSQAGNPIVRVMLDDPSFPASLNASLVENREGKFSLLWSRAR